jgi:cytosine/creatinine deaminase
MLVLSRQKDQSIMIGDDIGVTIVDIRGDKVRLGVTAPKHVSVHRREVYEAILRENRDASRLRPDDLPSAPPPPGNGAKAEWGAPPRDQRRTGGRTISSSNSSSPAPANNAPHAAADPFLRAAIDEAKRGLAEGGLPIGSVLVRGGQVIGRGHNRRVQSGDPMAHAEIDCLRSAGRQRTYRDTVLYSTLMPCYLCTGAVLQFGIPRVIVGESVNFKGGCGPAHCDDSPRLLHAHGVEVTDLHNPECVEMMSAFIRQHQDLWNEDIGK